MMTREKLIKMLVYEVEAWLDKRPTGSLNLEINAKDGMVGRCYTNNRILLQKNNDVHKMRV